MRLYTVLVAVDETDTLYRGSTQARLFQALRCYDKARKLKAAKEPLIIQRGISNKET